MVENYDREEGIFNVTYALLLTSYTTGYYLLNQEHSYYLVETSRPTIAVGLVSFIIFMYTFLLKLQMFILIFQVHVNKEYVHLNSLNTDFY